MTSTLPDGAVSPIGLAPQANTKSESPDSELLVALIKQRELEAKKLAWAAWVEREYTRCRNARQAFERQWFINLAFFNGKHYLSPIEVGGQGFRLTTPKAPPWRVRLVINNVRTAALRECSKLTSGRPIPTVVPASNEGEDFTAAQVGEQLIKSDFATAESEEQTRDWVWWGVVTGVSFMKQWWDPNSLDYNSMSVPEPLTMPDGTPVPEELISQIQGAKEYMETPVPAQGRICRERVNPFHIYVPDLLTKRLEGQPYVIQVMTRHPEWVKKAFGLDNVTADSRAASTVMEAASLITKGSEEHMDSVLVKEIWIKPGHHPDFPKGGVLTVVNSKVVQCAEEWPLPYPEYPFYKYDGIPTGGFYSDSTLVDLIPVNKEYNRKRSQMLEIQNTMGKPKLVYQQGSLDPRKISSEPGQSIPYKAGYQPPQVVQGAEVPNSFFSELEVLKTDFADLAGQHEISRGQTPQDVTSGTAIAFLQEQDDTLLNYKVASLELAYQMMGRHYLHLVASYWDESRVVKITGKNQQFEVIHWKKNALRGNLDVRVQTGSALPVSKAARQALINEWMTNGWLDPVMGMEILEIGDLAKVADELLTDKRQAQRENLKMAEAPEQLLEMLLNPSPGPNGEPPQQVEIMGPDGKPQQRWLNGDGTPFQPQPPIPVNSWDNNEEHIHWHNQFRKTQEFELLPQVNKDAFEMHVQLHQLAVLGGMVNQQNQVVQPGAEPPPLEEEGGELPPGEQEGETPPQPPQ